MGTCLIFYKVYNTTYIVMTFYFDRKYDTVHVYMSNYQERYIDYLVRKLSSFHNRTVQLLCFSVIDINLLTMFMNILVLFHSCIHY